MRRHGVHVSREHQVGRLAGHTRVHVPAIALVRALPRLRNTGLLDLPVSRSEIPRQKIPHRPFVIGSRLDVHQCARKLNGIKRREIGHMVPAYRTGLSSPGISIPSKPEGYLFSESTDGPPLT